MVADSPYASLQLILNALPGQVAVLSTHGRLLLVNHMWETTEPDGLMVHGKRGDDYLAHCDAAMVSGIRDVLSGKSDEFALDYPAVVDAQVRWFNVRFRPYDDGIERGALITHEDITARMESEIARSDSDRMLDSLIDASPLAIIGVDLECNVTRWNSAAEQMFGWQASDVLGSQNPVVPEADHMKVFEEIGSGQGDTIEARRICRDGTVLDVEISRAPILAADGTLRGAVGIIKDITDEKRWAEQREFLSDASRLLAVSLDYKETMSQIARLAVPRMADICAVNLINEDGTIERHAAAHHDPVKNEMLQNYRQQFDIPGDAPWGTAKVLRTGQPDIKQWPEEPEGEDSERLKILRELGLRSTLVVPLLSREKVIGTIALIYGESGRVYREADITVAMGLAERAAFAIENAQLYREARTAEGLYRTIVDHVPAITYTAHADDLAHLTFISNQSQVQRGNDGEVVDGVAWVSRLHPDDAGRVRNAMAECTRTGKPLEVEYRVLTQDGNVSWRLDRANLIRDDRGNSIHWQGVVVDITERREAEAVIRTRARQQASVAMLGQRVIGDVDIDAVFDDAAQVVNDTLNTDYVSVAIHNPAHGSLEIKAMAGTALPGNPSPVTMVDSPSLMTHTFTSRAPVVVEDLETETRFTPWQGMVDAGIRSAISVVVPGPVEPYGVILAATTRSRKYTNDDVMFMQSIANMVSSAYEHFRDEGELRFQAHLLDVISQAVVATDRDGRITHWNRHAEALYGWTREEAMGQSALDIMPTRTTFDQMADVFSTLLTGGSWKGDIKLQRRDGSTFDGWAVLSPLIDRAGEAIGMVSVSADISERVRVNSERERLLYEVGERVKELTVLHRAAALFEGDGQPLDLVICELVEMLPIAMQHPQLAVVRVRVGETWASTAGYVQSPWAIRSEFQVPGGDETGVIEVSYADPNPHEGEMLFVPEEYTLVETLCEMLMAYLQRVHSHQQVLKSEARFRAATEGTLDAFGILEPVYGDSGVAQDYRFAEVNARAEVLLRKTRQELVGSTLFDLFSPQQAVMFVEAFNHVIKTGETIEREVEVPRETDSFWMMFQAVALGDGVAAFASDTSERRRLEQQLMHQAFHDALTGLPNRALFLDRVEHARMRVRLRHEGIAVLFLDLDNFKLINDSLGHAAGDELLVEVAGRLLNCIGPGDTAARLGGDEFAILLEDLSDWASVHSVAESVVDAFEQPFQVMGREVFITPSVGVAIGTSINATASDLLRDADAAMYRAKRNGKGRVEVFDPKLAEDVIARFELENDLRRAIERDEFSVVYQPVVRMRSGEIAAMEALVRWNHPVHGQIVPGLFIPIAEETGMIIQIGQHVLERACKDAVEWNLDRPEGKRIKVSVNISARQFRHPELVEQVIDVLDSTGLPADLLFLEITETMMIDDVERARETLDRLHGLGAHIAVDDFGTGYSSLGSIRQFPVEVVKVDRTFVSGFDTSPMDEKMLSGIIDLAHGMDLRVVAEGVETAGERDRLLAMGCDLAQGYFYARPLPKNELRFVPL